MEKKYQVFISSTYTDLVEERREVIESLLQMNCFPVGMEYFNAADQYQWEMIKKLIDDCDYYVLIVAGRYGSVDETTGKSFTQMEYEYAVSRNKTVLRFVHDNIGELKAHYVESTDEGRQKLVAFREDVKKKYCKMWNTTSELKAQVILSLTNQFGVNPQVGWIKADQISSEQANKEILRLREENDILRAKVTQYEEMSPAGIENLSQGEDKFKFRYGYLLFDREFDDFTVTWNQIISITAPLMLGECNEARLKQAICSYVKAEKRVSYSNMSIVEDDFQTIKVQMIALGIIQESVKKRAASDVNTYWTLTLYGKRLLMQIKALKREAAAES